MRLALILSLPLNLFNIYRNNLHFWGKESVKKKNGIHYSDADCKFIWMKQNFESNMLILCLVTSEFLLLILFLLSSNQKDWICIRRDWSSLVCTFWAASASSVKRIIYMEDCYQKTRERKKEISNLINPVVLKIFLILNTYFCWVDPWNQMFITLLK